jgi:methyl-accepting chemotaxis protein
MKLNIKTKLIGGFSIAIVLMLSIFGIGYLGMYNSSQSITNINTSKDEDYYWTNWKAAIMRAGFDFQAYFSSEDEYWLNDGNERIKESELQKENLSKVISPSRQEAFDTVSTQASDIFTLYQSTVSTLKSKGLDTLTANRVISVSGEKVDNLVTLINKTIVLSQADTVVILEKSQKSQNLSTLLMVGICGLAIIFALGLAILMSQSISRGVNTVKKGLQKMAQGDLTEKIQSRSKDEIGEMVKSYNEMQTYLSTLVTNLKSNAVQLSAASATLSNAAQQSSSSTQQVATSSQQMAKGAQEQSINAQETTTSINQLSEAISQLSKGASEQSAGVQQAVNSITAVAQTLTEVAGSANQAAEGARQAAEAAQDGAENAKQTLSGMDKIKASTGEVARKIEELGARSAEIGKIVAVIDDIAAQTNLLALNAAIEAARAGEQGRGFAVVSDEVRKLAERSATATKEIADLIGNIQKGVDQATQVMAGGNAAVAEGYDLAVKAGQSLEKIQKTADHVNAQIVRISAKAQQVNTTTNELVKVIDSVGSITEENTAATEKMANSAAQVSKAMETVAGIAEENSAATQQVSASAQEMSAQVEEIVASSRTLKDMAVVLEQSVAMFKVDSAETSPVEAAVPASPCAEGQSADPAVLAGVSPSEGEPSEKI